MTRSQSRTSTALGVVGVAVLLLTGCGSSADPTPTETNGTSTPTTGPTPAQPDHTATPKPVDGAACETLIDSDTLDQLHAQGWTYQESTFSAGGVTIPTGLQCEWGDLENASTSNLMLFGWAPITADETSTMQSNLVAEGWDLETTARGTFVSDSFGMTYEFGDGWVIVSDLRDQLLLIQRPGA